MGGGCAVLRAVPRLKAEKVAGLSAGMWVSTRRLEDYFSAGLKAVSGCDSSAPIVSDRCQISHANARMEKEKGDGTYMTGWLDLLTTLYGVLLLK